MDVIAPLKIRSKCGWRNGGTPTYDLLLLDFNGDDFTGTIAIDRDANIVWYYNSDKRIFTASQEDDRNMVLLELADVSAWSMLEISPDGRIINSVNDILENGSVCQPHGRWSHEVLLRPDGKVWTIGAEIRPVNINGNITLQRGLPLKNGTSRKEQ